jgi:hypothetical protein
MAQLPPHPETLLTEEEQPKHTIDPEHINPKVASDIAYWSKEFGVDGTILHEAIRMHGTSVEKIRKHLQSKHDVNLT